MGVCPSEVEVQDPRDGRGTREPTGVCGAGAREPQGAGGNYDYGSGGRSRNAWQCAAATSSSRRPSTPPGRGPRRRGNSTRPRTRAPRGPSPGPSGSRPECQSCRRRSESSWATVASGGRGLGRGRASRSSGHAPRADGLR